MICIIDCGTNTLAEIKEIVSTLGHEYTVFKLDQIPESFESFSGIIISGGPILLTQTDPEPYLKKFKFIKTTEKPILGICLGHQIMGMEYGATIKRGKHIDKMEDIEIINKNILFEGINESTFKEDHSEYISLPEGFILLARSSSCDNEAMKHTSKNLYGVQFHPEVSGKIGKRLFMNFLELC